MGAFSRPRRLRAIDMKKRADGHPAARGRRAAALLCAALICAALALPVRAPGQQPPASASPADAGAQPPADVMALLQAVADIDILRLINPLKLAASQLDKLAATIEAAQKTYVDKLAGAAGPPLRKMADEIKATRKKVVAGEPIPADFDARMKAADAAYTKDRDQINLDNFKNLIAKTHAVLSDAQFQTAADLMKKQNPDKSSDTTTDQWYNLYVLRVFVSYPRIVPLLKEMKTARAQPAQ
jgi:hypothetical protein